MDELVLEGGALLDVCGKWFGLGTGVPQRHGSLISDSAKVYRIITTRLTICLRDQWIGVF